VARGARRNASLGAIEAAKASPCSVQMRLSRAMTSYVQRQHDGLRGNAFGAAEEAQALQREHRPGARGAA
jgi:hypothetical protein